MESYLNPYQLFTSWQSVVGTMVFVLIAYLIGSFNAGRLYSHYKDKDLGSYGSKNYGATNAGRIFGTYGFIIVFTIDFTKGIFAGLFLAGLYHWIGFFNGSSSVHNNGASIPLALIFVVVGHIYPIFFRFKGGKGVATSYGVFTIINWFFAFLGGMVFLFIFFGIKKKVYLGSLGSILFVSLIFFLQPLWPVQLVFDWTMSWDTIVMVWVIFLLVLYAHRSNIKKDWIKYKEGKED